MQKLSSNFVLLLMSEAGIASFLYPMLPGGDGGVGRAVRNREEKGKKKKGRKKEKKKKRKPLAPLMYSDSIKKNLHSLFKMFSFCIVPTSPSPMATCHCVSIFCARVVLGIRLQRTFARIQYIQSILTFIFPASFCFMLLQNHRIVLVGKDL